MPDDWPEAPCAYMQLSRFYPESVRRARQEGWLFEHIESHHFLPLAAPLQFAAALREVVGALQA